MFEDEERKENLRNMLRGKLNSWQERWEELNESYKDKDNYRQFFIGGFELQSLDEWIIKHNLECPYYDDGTKVVSPQGAIGGRLSYSFTPTGLGTAVNVECACGAKENLTDYDNW